MFNLFNRKTAKEFMEDAKETYQVPPMPEVKPPAEECPYTIGPTSDGRTLLRVTNGYSIMNLTMSETAVRQMIRLLEASISESEE